MLHASGDVNEITVHAHRRSSTVFMFFVSAVDGRHGPLGRAMTGMTLPLFGVSTAFLDKTLPLFGVSTAFLEDTAFVWCFHCLRG